MYKQIIIAVNFWSLDRFCAEIFEQVSEQKSKRTGQPFNKQISYQLGNAGGKFLL
jgi:hypothetical protein